MGNYQKPYTSVRGVKLAVLAKFLAFWEPMWAWKLKMRQFSNQCAGGGKEDFQEELPAGLQVTHKKIATKKLGKCPIPECQVEE